MRLNWEPIEGIGTWFWQVALDPGFTQLVAFQGADEPTALVLGLQPDTRHYARVAATRGGVPGEYSAVIGFTTRAFEPDGFMDWASLAGLDPDAPLGDADGDGYSALEEYAFGLDPAARSPNPFTYGTTMIEGVARFTVSVVIRVDDDALSYRVRGGDTLPPAEELDPTSLYLTDPEPAGPGFERVTLVSPVPLTAAQAFFTLEVRRTEPGR